MCCRYAINEAVIARYPSIRRLGDVRPSDSAPAIVADGIATLSWGFEGKDKRRPVINARCETAWEKPMFLAAMVRRRCVLPAAWFYEWDRQKRRNAFHPADGGILFLAGLYSETGRFVILTTVADETMRPVHDRMPLCLPETAIRDWLADTSAAREMLKMPGVPLRRKKPIEQGSLL